MTCGTCSSDATTVPIATVECAGERFVAFPPLSLISRTEGSEKTSWAAGQVLRSGYMDKKGGGDVWRSDGTLEHSRNWTKGGRRNWQRRWVVLFTDGELA